MAENVEVLRIIARAEAQQAIREMNSLQKGMAGTGKTVTSFQSGLGALNRLLGPIGLGLSLAAAVRALRGASRAASDAEEQYAKFRVVFGDLSQDVAAWADTYSREVGRATGDTIKFLASVQDTLVPMGFMRGEASDLSRQMVALATDIGSFNNQPTDRVLQAITSAMTGQTRSMMQYGVVIRQTDVEQEALNMGIWDGVGALTAQQRAQATMNLILKGTVDAQGDAVRTADSFANTQRRLEAATTSLREAIGANVNRGLQPFYDWLGRVIQRAADTRHELNELEDTFRRRDAGEQLTIQDEYRLATAEVENLRRAMDALAASEGQATARGGVAAGNAIREERNRLEGEYIKALAEQERLAQAVVEVETERQRALRESEERERELRETEERAARNAAALEDWLGRVNDAYARTTEGRIEALRAEIAWFENAAEQAERTSHMFEPILRDLRAQLELLEKTDEVASDLVVTFEDMREEVERLRRAHDPSIALMERQRELAEQIAFFMRYGMVEEAQVLQEELRRVNAQLEAMRTPPEVTAELTRAQEAAKKLEETLINIHTKAFEDLSMAFGAMAVNMEDGIQGIKDAMKNMIADTMIALGRQFFVQAAAAAAALQFGQAAGFTAASAAAFAAAGAIRALGMGGDFVASSPQLIMVGERGRERVRVDRQFGDPAGHSPTIINQYVSGSVWQTSELEALALNAMNQSGRRK